MMTPELAKRLALVFPTAASQGTGVARVAVVADATRYASKSAELRQLRPLRHEIGNAGETANEGVAADLASVLAPDADAIEERAALAADSVPACYLDAWARINHQKPATVSEAESRLAIDDGGRFLDAWGGDAATMRWTPGFDVPRDGRPGGLVWQLKGERVDALGEDRAWLEDGRTIKRGK
jgi:hypothetical protein